MQWYWLVLGVLGTWRVAHLLSAEDGPWQVVARVRRRLGGSGRDDGPWSGFWGGLMDCFACVSLWVAAPLAAVIAETPRQGVLLWLACSGGAMLVERVTARQTGDRGGDGDGDPGHDPPVALYVEHPEGDHDAVLR